MPELFATLAAKPLTPGAASTMKPLMTHAILPGLTSSGLSATPIKERACR